MCSINPQTNEYECQCLPGYTGTGYQCEPTYAEPGNKLDEETEEEEKPEETPEEVTEKPTGRRVPESCLLGVCWCPEGMTKEKDTRYCVEKVEETTVAVPEKEDDRDESKFFYGRHYFDGRYFDRMYFIF